MMPQHSARRIQLASVVALVIASDPASVMAQEGARVNVRANVEYQYADIESKDEDTGDRTDSDFSRLKQKYDVELQKELFPFLEFRTGGIFELIDVSNTTERPDPDFLDPLPEKTGGKERTRWLYAELNLDTPLYTAATAYRRREFEFDPRFFPKTEISREEFSGLFRWRPVGFPLFDLDIDSVHTWDQDDTVDLDADRLIFKSRYGYKDFDYDYTYTRNDTKEKIEDTGSLIQLHNGLIQYSADFLDDRLQVNSSARSRFQSQDPHGGGVIDRPTSSSGLEFFFTNDLDPDTLTPVTPGDPLDLINIGRDGPFNPVSVGLAFGFPTEVSKVHILILPATDCKYDLECSGPEYGQPAGPGQIASIADDYVWEVSWSDDQENWNDLGGVKATYRIVENRFEITFDRVEGARFIKVATIPKLDAPGEIRTSAIQAFTTLAVSPGTKLEDFDQNFNLGLRWIISDRTETSYEGFFRYRNAKPFDITRKNLTNSISLRHFFSPKLTANARVLRTDTTETDRDDLTHHSYSASLRADYLETLNQTLTYSGFHDDLGGDTNYANSLFLRTNADLYEGWSSNLDLGFSAKHPIEGGNLTNTTVRISTDVDPNPKLNFAIDYRFSWNTETGEPSWLDQNARFQGFWVPVRTLSLFAAVRLRYRERDADSLQVSQNYSVNWSPFPDGLLRFSLGYNRTVDTNNNKTSALSPQIDWEVTRTTLLTLRFNLGTVETDQETRDVKNVRLNLRTYY
jgi:hypothetical protein